VCYQRLRDHTRYDLSMALSVQGLSKRYSKETSVLCNVHLEVAEGELVVIVGPSGSGKSTLLHCIAGLLQPDSGEIVIDGRCISNEKPHLRGIGLVMQDQPLYEHLSVRANIGFPLRSKGSKRADINSRVDEALSALGLECIATRRVSKLSGGERRRVALGRAIIVRPRILLLDEPLVSLDLALQKSLQSLIRKVHDDTLASTILVTHNHDEAASLGDRVVAMTTVQAC